MKQKHFWWLRKEFSEASRGGQMVAWRANKMDRKREMIKKGRRKEKAKD